MNNLNDAELESCPQQKFRESMACRFKDPSEVKYEKAVPGHVLATQGTQIEKLYTD